MGVVQSDVNESKKKVKNNENFEEREDITGSLIYAECINGKKKKNDLTGQDSNDIITRELGENIKYFGVYDGHGIKGREASMMLKYEIHKNLIKEKKRVQRFVRKEQVDKFFKELFRDIQKKYDNRSNDYELSGSCAICILIVDYKMFCINLGDSRAVLGSRKNGKMIALEMSIDHKPNRDDESKRIIEKGGEVSEKISGVSRVFKKNDELPGLAVSRSVGDIVAHECGVISEPEIIEKELEAEDVFVVIASDGVWDSMSSTEIVGFIFEKMENKKDTVCKMVVEECRNRWEIINLFKQKQIVELVQSKESNNVNGTKSKDAYQNVLDIDDITAVIHFFNLDY